MTKSEMKKAEEVSSILPRKVAIVMITRNSEKHLQAALDAIINYTRYPYKLIIVESESTDNTHKICDAYANAYPQIEVHHTKKEGALKAINYGMKVAAPYDVFLTHDDVIVPKLYRRDWLSELVICARKENAGAATTVNGTGLSGPDYIDGFEWVGTWAWYINRKTIEKIGYFDEGFGLGNGDDIDYSYRIYKSGFQVYKSDIWVDHHRLTEHVNDQTPELEQLKQKNALYFRKKYGIKLTK